ncbi:MAG: undecaprenyl-diphosphate phosphatase [Candidatus Acidiferrales bacterium]
MWFLHVILLAIVQGLAELLPVSSSAHVIVAERLMGMDPTSPAMTLLLVMLHTGTMLAVIVYFWGRWRRSFFENAADFRQFVIALILATAVTGVIGYGLIKLIEKFAFPGRPHAWVEELLFGRLDLIAVALAVVGILILVAGLMEKRLRASRTDAAQVNNNQALWIGGLQGLCLPFRGFSRSGATISTGMLAGVQKARAEDFSFALAVILTPPALARELWRLHQTPHAGMAANLGTSLVGTAFAFLAGLLALKWLSRWLETGRWYLFGIYCLIAAVVVAFLYHAGY